MGAELPAGTRTGGHTAESEGATGALLGGHAISDGAEEAENDWPAQTVAESRKAVQIFEIMECIFADLQLFNGRGIHFQSILITRSYL